jgi:hypothetical protein
MGFAGRLAEELDAGTIRDLDSRIVEMYLPDSEHYGAQAVVAVFRRTAPDWDRRPPDDLTSQRSRPRMRSI